jgi:hypothetical protein
VVASSKMHTESSVFRVPIWWASPGAGTMGSVSFQTLCPVRSSIEYRFCVRSTVIMTRPVTCVALFKGGMWPSVCFSTLLDYISGGPESAAAAFNNEAVLLMYGLDFGFPAQEWLAWRFNASPTRSDSSPVTSSHDALIISDHLVRGSVDRCARTRLASATRNQRASGNGEVSVATLSVCPARDLRGRG